MGGSMRGAFGAVAWRYRSAPLWARVSLDVSAAVLVLALLAGGALALRAQGGPEGVAGTAAGDTPSTSAGGDGGGLGPIGPAAVPTSSTTTSPPTTRPATSAPTTAATVPPTTAPPTTPTTAAPPTTPTTGRPGPPGTDPEPHYRTCFDAWRAGALPLFEGEPGYSRRLDDDGDGQACEFGEGF
jgi:hypothetical protein